MCSPFFKVVHKIHVCTYTCNSDAHDVTDFLQVYLTLKQVTMDKLEWSRRVQLVKQAQHLAKKQPASPDMVRLLKLNGQPKLEGGGQNALRVTFVLSWTQFFQQLLRFKCILFQLLKLTQ